MWLFVLFIGVPLIEIGLFIQVGGAIGLWPTLAIVVLTAIAGTSLMRHQGMVAMSNIRNSFGTLSDPSEPLAHGAMILFAGALLLTPGFFTDTVGFLLLFPPFRAAAFRWLRTKVKVQSFSTHGAAQGGPNHRPHPNDDVVDGDFEEIEPNNPKIPGNSGWTQD